MLRLSENIIDSLGLEGEAIPLTWDKGLMMKSFLTTVFDGYSCIANLIRLSLRPRFLFGIAYN